MTDNHVQSVVVIEKDIILQSAKEPDNGRGASDNIFKIRKMPIKGASNQCEK